MSQWQGERQNKLGLRIFDGEIIHENRKELSADANPGNFHIGPLICSGK
jgi:hypothetical protein